ncbi:hypothetical protein BGM30_28100 [Microcystis aeruginosa NIES-298]|uniref:Uncharacterized protein n=1 Tax=Microcystis aeruginosa NIES-298 TaxID=449468 RepID=A0A9P2YKD4_MICAE|nr:hypothetical protein BGM30_28100 [Microcystis aeruginosa NIES-298]
MGLEITNPPIGSRRNNPKSIKYCLSSARVSGKVCPAKIGSIMFLTRFYLSLSAKLSK